MDWAKRGERIRKSKFKKTENFFKNRKPLPGEAETVGGGGREYCDCYTGKKGKGRDSFQRMKMLMMMMTLGDASGVEIEEYNQIEFPIQMKVEGDP